MLHRVQGASRLADGRWEFVLWAPFETEITLQITEPRRSSVRMNRDACGFHSASIDRLDPDTKYLYELRDGRRLPDPASRFQPQGVHGPSQVLDPDSFLWTDDSWRGRDLASSIFYELHVGTFTDAGTFDAVIPHLDELADLGITTVELMPVAQFPGGRNWGYDGVHPYAAQNSYGGPLGLQRFVDAAHHRGLAVALDVVYNHLGPEGNYLGAYGPYFRSRYKTPWGEALNFDGPDSEQVRRFFIDNALYWLEQFHIDALRLDAIHGIFDFSAKHILEELQDDVRRLSSRAGRQMHVIAESDLNDARILHSKEHGGYALDAQWSDDFHHAVHTLLTGELAGYYEDFGALRNLTETLDNGWCYTGQYSRFRKRRFGNSPAGIARNRFVVCTQNHDQVGNRARGERLTALVGLEALKLAAGIALLSPLTPLLFMGEEYAEVAPFLYFVSHGDSQLVEAVRRGRAEEFSSFGWKGEIPDPQAESTFAASHLDHSSKQRDPHRTLFHFYKQLIALRNAQSLSHSGHWEVQECGDRILALTHGCGPQPLTSIFNFSAAPRDVELPLPRGEWKIPIQSSDAAWLGSGAGLPPAFYSSGSLTTTLQPWSFVVLEGAAKD